MQLIFTKTVKFKDTTDEIIDNFGKKIYQDLRNDLQRELESVNKEACIDYAYNLVLNRTYEGYRSEIDTIYGQLQNILNISIEPASDEWDRNYNVDFFIKVKRIIRRKNNKI